MGWGRPALRRGYKKCSGAGRCGERTERCQWQKQRSERVAAVKISSVRRKAAQKFWAPQQGHRPLRKRILWCVGEGLCPSRGRPQGSPLRKSLPCLKGGGPAAGWWRDSRGEESPSHGFAVLRQGGHQPLRRFAPVLIPYFPTHLLGKYFLSVIVHPKPNRL